MKQKREFAVLKLLVRDWERWKNCPAIARMLVLKRKYFTHPIALTVATELILCDGDIHRAIWNLRGHSLPWLTRFTKWCDRVRGKAGAA